MKTIEQCLCVHIIWEKHINGVGADDSSKLLAQLDSLCNAIAKDMNLNPDSKGEWDSSTLRCVRFDNGSWKFWCETEDGKYKSAEILTKLCDALNNLKNSKKLSYNIRSNVGKLFFALSMSGVGSIEFDFHSQVQDFNNTYANQSVSFNKQEIEEVYNSIINNKTEEYSIKITNIQKQECIVTKSNKSISAEYDFHCNININIGMTLRVIGILLLFPNGKRRLEIREVKK